MLRGVCGYQRSAMSWRRSLVWRASLKRRGCSQNGVKSIGEQAPARMAMRALCPRHVAQAATLRRPTGLELLARPISHLGWRHEIVRGGRRCRA